MNIMTTTSEANDSYWSLDELAEFLGVTKDSARTYHGRAEINRKHAQRPVGNCKICQSGGHRTKTGDLPPPDRRFGRSPVWFPSTIKDWVATRPGRGAGGGPGASTAA